MVVDHFIDDEAHELLGEIGVKPGLHGEPLQPGDLDRLAGRIRRRQTVPGLEPPDLLGAAEALGQMFGRGGMPPGLAGGPGAAPGGGLPAGFPGLGGGGGGLQLPPGLGGLGKKK